VQDGQGPDGKVQGEEQEAGGVQSLLTGVVVGQSKAAEEQDADSKSQGEKWKTGGQIRGQHQLSI
jgi:hypothetical protein